jgi:regulator of protease activity HflC (stomatin/prohibitin superfamily)
MLSGVPAEVVPMTMQAPVQAEQQHQAPAPASAPVAEYAARSTAGIKVLVGGIVVIIAAIVLLVYGGKQGGGTTVALGWAGAIAITAAALMLGGLTPIAPGEARVIQLFGKYRGTTRDPGLQWVNPFSRRIKVSTRIRNHETAQAKVNDADGNPIEIAAVVVWQVQDTAKASYAVDEYVKFVAIQTETAVRHIASSYPYTSQKEGDLSLRENAEEITAKLSAEIADRVRAAGVAIIESRLTRLSYAAEIAQAMLRQQQASAVVGARARIVEGAVGMVQLALKRLEEEGVVELDEERKATMVSNLLVVLCSEQATQPIVNTGTLYQ